MQMSLSIPFSEPASTWRAPPPSACALRTLCGLPLILFASPQAQSPRLNVVLAEPEIHHERHILVSLLMSIHVSGPQIHLANHLSFTSDTIMIAFIKSVFCGLFSFN